jgi:hypothetical protein
VSPIEVIEFRPEHVIHWKDFLQQSNNGTLFHDLDFLAYHAAEQFNTHHLLFREDGKWVALLPAALAVDDEGRRILKSPYGASVGGFALPRRQSAETTHSLVARLQEYAAASAFDGIEMRVSPHIYLREPNDHLSYALSANGFQLSHRWLCHSVALATESQDTLAQFKRGKQRDIRAGLRRNLQPREVAADMLKEFYDLLLATETKHGAKPTHRLEELEDLFRRVPNRLRLFLCARSGREFAGVLVFVLNSVAAYTFYICQDESGDEPYATTVLVAYIAQKFGTDGFRHLDLGPSSFDDFTLNRGLVFFKEGFGARGFCRDSWRWVRG